MKAEDWKNIKNVLIEALKLDFSERWAFLEKANISAETREEVKSLLAFEEESEDLMRLSAIEFSKDFFDSEDAKNILIGQRVGIYEIVSELGYGGMGAVYLANRTDGKFQQTVALKLLKREMNTSALRQRFRQEREILASLEHPNIARLLDAGTTDDQIPFLAMEYVEGLPIDDYCNRHELDLSGRLNLFCAVCEAVNYAHRNLIVHRDLKPSNILVTEDGTPKLLDFGISKIISTEMENINAATITKMGVMTPGYASPEQLSGESVTTATDIYSLGVILYELLSGHRPFENKEADLKEIYRAVIDADPPLPSAAFETISKSLSEKSSAVTEIKSLSKNNSTSKNANKTKANDFRHTAPQIIGIKPQFLRGDLDNIVLKALKKEPERRYSSAENFSADIKRHLDGLPVTARPDTFSYRAEKFIKRNRASVFAGSLILLAIIAGLTTTFWQAKVASAERVKAEKRFSEVRKLANSYLFDVYPQIENLEGSLKARETILTNALEYLDSLSNEASGDLELQSELATAYEKIGDVQGALNNQNLGNVKAGLESYEKARKLREAVYFAEPENLTAKEKLANNFYTTARTLWNNSQTKEAEESFEKGLKLRRELVAANPNSVDAQNRLAVLLIDYSAIPAFNFQAEKTLVLLNEALEIVQKLRQKDAENPDFKKTLARALRIMSKAKVAVGDYNGALDGLNTAVVVSAELAKQFPEDFRLQRAVWLTDVMICELFIDKGDGQKSVETCGKTIEFNRNVVQKEPANGVAAYDLAISYFNLARGFRLADNPAGTIENAEKAIDVMMKLVEKNPENNEYKRNIAIYETEIARAHLKLNQPDRAIQILQKIQSALKPIIEGDKEVTTYQYDLALAHRLLAEAYFKKNEKAKAIENVDSSIIIIQTLAALKSLRESDRNLLAEMEKEKADYSK